MDRLHPIVNFIYFAIVLGCSMVWMHPVCLMITFAAAFCYTGKLFGLQNARGGLFGMAVIMLVAAIMNPAFSHQGVTRLCYLPSGNALTMESICYGIAAAVMLGATVMWFRCVSEILTTDKIVYLFGRPFPVVSMVLAMVLGFLPKMQRKLREIRYAQNIRETYRAVAMSENHTSIDGSSSERTDGEDTATERTGRTDKMYRIRLGVENISLLITWALQDAMDMAESMKGRGYGLPGRTAYTTFRFTKWDRTVLFIILSAFFYLAAGAYAGGLDWDYYPMLGGAGFGIYTISLYIVYGVLCFLPVAMEQIEEDRYNKR